MVHSRLTPLYQIFGMFLTGARLHGLNAHSHTHDITITSSPSSPTDPEPLQPPLGMRRRSSLYRACRKNQIIPYISLSSVIIVRPLLGHNLHCSCHPHTGSLVLRSHSLLNIHSTVDASSAPGCLVVASCTIRALIVPYMGEEAQERRLFDVDVPEGDDPIRGITPIYASLSYNRVYISHQIG